MKLLYYMRPATPGQSVDYQGRVVPGGPHGGTLESLSLTCENINGLHDSAG